jgi:hypothetical protein
MSPQVRVMAVRLPGMKRQMMMSCAERGDDDSDEV